MAAWNSGQITLLPVPNFPAITGSVNIANYYRSGNAMYYTGVTVTVNALTAGWWFAFNIVVNGLVAKNSSPDTWSTFTVALPDIGANTNNGPVTWSLSSSSNNGTSNVNTWNLPVIAPSTPGVPNSISATPTAPAPGAAVTITSGASTAGTTAVGGYEVSYSKNGGTWTVISGTGTTRTLNLTGWVHGNTLKVRSRAYCTVNNAQYWSGYKESSSYTVTQPASGVPYNLTISPQDPAPGEDIVLNWTLPDTVNGYEVRLYKNGIVLETQSVNTKNLTVNLAAWENLTTFAFSIRAYITSGDSTIYSDWSQITIAIQVRSRIFCHISEDGGDLLPHKVFVVRQGAAPVELFITDMSVIGGG